jgi:2-deoxy-D-gluconate 3-dehydrogenase
MPQDLLNFAQPVNFGNLLSLAGKTAIVTGGTGELILSMTMALASAGAEIISMERPHSHHGHQTMREAIQALGRSFKAHECNAGDIRSLRACYSQI